MALISVSIVTEFRQNYCNVMRFFSVVENDLYCGKDFGKKKKKNVCHGKDSGHIAYTSK